MQNIAIENLVEDWGGFEQLVAKLHETGDVKVERDVVLKGRSGAPRQIDVLLRHKQGLYEHLVIVECKYWSRNVERNDVDALVATVREVGASRGVIFSSKGFQSGAITQVLLAKIPDRLHRLGMFDPNLSERFRLRETGWKVAAQFLPGLGFHGGPIRNAVAERRPYLEPLDHGVFHGFRVRVPDTPIDQRRQATLVGLSCGHRNGNVVRRC